MSGLSKREFLKRVDAAEQRVRQEISDHASQGGIYARGVASEGYAGGYLQALYDCQSLLINGYPNDPRNYWKQTND